jgi:purine-cytosine permease-like protein
VAPSIRSSTSSPSAVILAHIQIISLTASRLGFATTTVIFGGQALANVNPGTLPLAVGIIIICVCSLIPCFIGYNMVHIYERYAWMVIMICMLFLCGLGGKAGYDVNAQKSLEDTGRALSADILSFGGIVFGTFTGVGSTVNFTFHNQY